MTLIAFPQVFPDFGWTETRWVHVYQNAQVPIDTYGLVEYFCVDPECDCHSALNK